MVGIVTQTLDWAEVSGTRKAKETCGTFLNLYY